ncbi:MAG: thiamine diphosphokinase [Anaerolineaceae bacterium]
MTNNARAVLFANGQAEDPTLLRLEPGDFLVAVDGGLHHLRILGLNPQMLVGDLDSVTAREVEDCAANGVEILHYPPAKDQTDLELALDQAIARGYRRILIAFALGGRLDHTLANLALLSRPDLTECEVRLDDGLSEVLLLRDEIVLITAFGERVSLLPWGGPAEGVRTKGLAYPLRDETLLPYQTRGVSNLATGESCSISLQKGALLVIHQRKIPETKGEKA